MPKIICIGQCFTELLKNSTGTVLLRHGVVVVVAVVVVAVAVPLVVVVVVLDYQETDTDIDELSQCLSVCLCLSLSLYVCLSVCLSVCQCLSICLSVCVGLWHRPGDRHGSCGRAVGTVCQTSFANAFRRRWRLNAVQGHVLMILGRNWTQTDNVQTAGHILETS